MQTKRFIIDFLCSFFIFALLLFSVVLICEHKLLDGAFIFDKTSGSFTLFGYSFIIDKRVMSIFYSLFKFNDTLFGKGFCEFLKNVCEFIFSLFSGVFKITYEFILKAVGGK